jgi:hypothetical protein
VPSSPAPQPPFDTCAFVRDITYPGPCSTPPPSPSPSSQAGCCETYQFTTFETGSQPCIDGNTIWYLDCNVEWQTAFLPPNSTTTLCLKPQYANWWPIFGGDCSVSVTSLGNCDCD